MTGKIKDLRSRIVGHDRVRASELLANPFNHRLHPEKQRKVVSASLEELGWVKSIIVNKRTGHIVDGHERSWQALQRGDDTMVDVEYVDLSEEEERKALLILDSSSELATVDAQALGALADLCSFDLPDLAAHAESMLASAGLFHKTEAEDDELPEMPKVARSKLGDLYELGEHRVLCGDSTKAEDVSRLLNGSRPSLMVTDPPYGVEYDPKWREIRQEKEFERTGKVLNDDRVDWSAAWRLFPGDVAYVWHAPTKMAEVQKSLEDVNFEIRSHIVWVKPHLMISRGHYHWQHEPALVVSRGDVSIEPDDPKEAESAWYAVRKGAKALWSGGRRRSTVWEIGFKGEVKTDHGTQKPVECMSRAMQNHGSPGDVVYDPFLGSGTSIVAAHRTGRRCYGMELNPLYVDLIVARYEALTGNKAKKIPAE